MSKHFIATEAERFEECPCEGSWLSGTPLCQALSRHPMTWPDCKGTGRGLREPESPCPNHSDAPHCECGDPFNPAAKPVIEVVYRQLEDFEGYYWSAPLVPIAPDSAGPYDTYDEALAAARRLLA